MKKQFELFDLPKMPEPNSENESYSKPRLNSPLRTQIEFIHSSIDDLVPDDHQVRNIWNYVNQIDLSPILSRIKSTNINPGRPAIDPKVLLALWIYATIEGIGSARLLDRYCTEHLAFRWLCGGVSVNYHSISDFRKSYVKELDDLISETISRLMKRELVTLHQVSQDGMRVRAAAGTSSFRRKPTLKELYVIAKEQVKILRNEIEADPSLSLNRQMAARKRAAEDRKNRIEQALNENKKLTIQKGIAKKKHRKLFTQEEKDDIRSSTTDPEARKMKMGHGGFSPAYNMQVVVDTKSRFIIGVEVINKNNDYGQLPVMFNQIKNRYKTIPERWLVDQGYLNHDDIIKIQKEGCKVYVNPKPNIEKTLKKNENKIDEKEHNELIEWRMRMGMDESKEIYKDRASNSEWANAGMRNRGLRQLLVRGLKNVQSILSLHALTHNILRAIKLGYNW